MPEDLTAPDDDAPKGAPTWMVTYADSVTLLLTFFVMLLTFSTPNKEDYGFFAHGLLVGSKMMGLQPGVPSEDRLAAEERLLLAGRLDEDGAEKPPLHGEDPLDELKVYYEDVDISQLKELRGARRIRIPLLTLFGTDTELEPRGKGVLDRVVKITRSRAYSVIVRAEVADEVQPQQRQAMSLLLAMRVVRYLRLRAGDACPDIGLSDNVELSPPPLPQGHCDIILLEV